MPYIYIYIDRDRDRDREREREARCVHHVSLKVAMKNNIVSKRLIANTNS